MPYDGGNDSGQGGTGFTSLGVGSLGSALDQLLLSNDAIVPGSDPGYQLCKTILSYHPLGLMLVSAPLRRAQSQNRIISVPVVGEERIVKQFETTFQTIGKLGATEIIHSLMMQSAAYGITSIGIGERGKDTNTPLNLAEMNADDLYFNILDPLNTAGSLVLSQDPNSPEYQKQGTVFVFGKEWHPSRTLSVLNEQPLYIEWSDSAFGFVGRSRYQRALYSLKTYLQIMVAVQWIAVKCGLLVWNTDTQTSVVDNLVQMFAGMKRAAIKSGVTNNVLQIGLEDKLESLNLEHIAQALEMARVACLKDIASETGMPASIIAQETLTSGFGEGTEDAKKEAAYLNHIRETMAPAYSLMDKIVQHAAWTKEFYATVQRENKVYRGVKYETALIDWKQKFDAQWPNVLQEPESEKSKTADVQFKSALGYFEAMAPEVDPVNKVKLIMWMTEQVNEREELFASQLDFDEDLLLEFHEEKKERDAEMAEAAGESKEPKPPAAFGMRS